MAHKKQAAHPATPRPRWPSPWRETVRWPAAIPGNIIVRQRGTTCLKALHGRTDLLPNEVKSPSRIQAAPLFLCFRQRKPQNKPNLYN